MPKPQFIMIAGTNGAGKSTLGKELEERYQIPFINKDLYYKNKYGDYLNFTHEQLKETSQELESKRIGYFTDKKSFAYEDVLTKEGAIYHLLRQARMYGFETSLIYLGVNNIETSNSRIQNRIKEGAHFVDPEIVRKNTQDSIATFKKVAHKFDNVTIYDNSNVNERFSPKRVYEIRGGVVKIDAKDKPLWARELVSIFDNKNIKTNDNALGFLY